MLLYTPLEQFQVLSFFTVNLFYFDLSFTNILLVTLLVFLLFLFKHYSDSAVPDDDEGYLTPQNAYIEETGTPESPSFCPNNGIIPIPFPESDPDVALPEFNEGDNRHPEKPSEESNTDEKQSKGSDRGDKPDKSVK